MRSAVRQSLSALRKLIRKVAGVEQDYKQKLPDESYLKRIDHTNPSLYMWVADVEKSPVNPQLVERAHELSTLNQEANRYIHLLLDDLDKAFPESKLDSFIFKTEGQKTRLPIFVLSPDLLGRPKFPVPIEDVSAPEVERGDDSLTLLRQAQKNVVLYPGKNYRLFLGRENGWCLGRTIYTELIEQCDYLEFHIKAGWQKLKNTSASPEKRKKLLQESSAAKEWIQRVVRCVRVISLNTQRGWGFPFPFFKFYQMVILSC